MQTLFLHECKVPPDSIFATIDGMVGDSLEADNQLVRALVEWSSMAPSAVAKRAGVAATTILRPYNGTATTRMGRETFGKLRAAFPDFPGFNALRPDMPTAPRHQDYVAIRVLPSYAGAGGGGSGEGDQLFASLPRQLIEEDLRGRPEDFELIDIRGDSAEPDFYHGDQILVDTRDRNPRQPGPFAIWDEDGYVLKLVERVPNRRGWYRIFSANPRYSSYEIEENEATIRGRPVWFARRL
jgi:phage repressor protein C with HTH and peptisase S24 domain